MLLNRLGYSHGRFLFYLSSCTNKESTGRKINYTNGLEV